MTRPDPATLLDVPQRRRWGALFGLIWLVYLADPVADALKHSGPARVLALVALAGFAVLYASIFVWARERMNPGFSSRRSWLILLALVGLGLAAAPGTGPSVLATSVYVVSAAMLLLPSRAAFAVVAVMFAVVEVLPRLIPGWSIENFFGIQLVIVGIAVWGISQMMRRHQMLEGAQAEIARLATQAERTRMARDLHDILGHSLTVITVKAELAGRLVAVDAGRAAVEIADVERLAREALADVRATISGAREVGVAFELASARAALSAAGIEAVLPGAVDDVPSQYREFFGWVIREGITNVVRHSNARVCTGRIGAAYVEVLDDGIGPHCQGNGPAGNGLAGLRERAGAADARLTITRAGPAGGFRLRADGAPILPAAR